MKYSVIINAAGKNATKGESYNKVFKILKREQITVLEKSIQLFLNDNRCHQIIVITNPCDMKNNVLSHSLEKVIHVNAGPSRQDSIFMALMAVKEDIVLIHDGARPWVDREEIDSLLDAMNFHCAATLAIKLNESIKIIKDGYIEESINDNNFMRIQSPQAFKTDLIINSYKKINQQKITVIDDCQAIELGSTHKVFIVEGKHKNQRVIV